MKSLKMIALVMALAFLAASCSQNHYAKSKRKMSDQRGLSPVAMAR